MTKTLWKGLIVCWKKESIFKVGNCVIVYKVAEKGKTGVVTQPTCSFVETTISAKGLLKPRCFITATGENMKVLMWRNPIDFSGRLL